MIDVSPKPDSLRTATARAVLHGQADSMTRLRERTLP